MRPWVKKGSKADGAVPRTSRTGPKGKAAGRGARASHLVNQSEPLLVRREFLFQDRKSGEAAGEGEVSRDSWRQKTKQPVPVVFPS